VANDAIHAVFSAERRGNLWAQRVLGYPVWPLERLRRYRAELVRGQVVERTGPSAPLESRLGALKAPLAQAAADARAFGLPRVLLEHDIWVLNQSAYRKPDASGELRCIFAEDLRAQLGERVVFLERINNDLVAPPRRDVLHIDALQVFAMLSAQAASLPLGKLGVVPAAQREAFALPSSYLCQLALYGRTLQAATERLIGLRRPAAVFVLCGYQPFVPMQRAIKAAGIPLIELQHGLIHESHPGYALDGGADADHVPDHLVVFGRRFAEIAAQACPYWRGRTSVGGHPWLREKSVRTRPLRERSDVILFGQLEQPVREALRALALELAPQLPSGMRIVIKPHPRESDADQYWGAITSDRIALAPFRADSYALLRDCRAAVSVYSTIALEAPAFGCPSIVLRSPLWSDDIRAMVDNGALLAADDPGDVLAALSSSATGADAANTLFGVATPALDYARLLTELQSVSGSVSSGSKR
jgi:hypothetical protein